jgi:hypothetical protein
MAGDKRRGGFVEDRRPAAANVDLRAEQQQRFGHHATQSSAAARDQDALPLHQAGFQHQFIEQHFRPFSPRCRGRSPTAAPDKLSRQAASSSEATLRETPACRKDRRLRGQCAARIVCSDDPMEGQSWQDSTTQTDRKEVRNEDSRI